MQRYRHGVSVLVLLLSACAAEDPESALVQLVDAAERAAESRDTGFFRDYVADSYADSRGNDRARIIDLIRGYFLVNQNIEVVTRIESVDLVGRDAAEIVVLAGILGRRPGEGILQGFDGRLYRLELELVEAGGNWQVIGASWERSLEALMGE
jgi:hypothetical protein